MKLSEIRKPEELLTLTVPEIESLADDARQVIIQTVLRNGGHLSSNLGIVELTLSLYHVFDFNKDKLLLDVGHQCYVHKLLTGRTDSFHTLRQDGGVCGFPRTEESPFDLFNTGHSSSALSLALGMARARDSRGEKHHIVCVVGDGALTGGLAYEALNDIGNSHSRLIIVLNDNGMSISGNVGALSEYLTFLRLSKGWQQLKHSFSTLLRKVPVCGKQLYKSFQGFKDHIRNIFVNDKFFSSLGIRYIGPVDGHDIARLTKVFRKIQTLDEPVLLHVMTRKGNGYPPAEEDPERFHNYSPETDGAKKETQRISFGKAACNYLISAAETDPRIVVITAAMTGGTGFLRFKERFPDRLFDVGIAEEHAVALAAGMAKGGLRPFVAIYDTFFQRSFDQILEEVGAQQLPIVLLSDRAEFNEADGMSHQGLYGNSFFRIIPGISLFTPVDISDMEAMLRYSLEGERPVVIRYPKYGQMNVRSSTGRFTEGKWHLLKSGSDAGMLAVGSNMLDLALRIHQQLAEEGIHVSVYGVNSVRPLDETSLNNVSGKPYFILEENELEGGFGSAVCEWAAVHETRSPYLFAFPGGYYSHGKREKILKSIGMDADSITDKIRKRVNNENQSGCKTGQ